MVTQALEHMMYGYILKEWGLFHMIKILNCNIEFFGITCTKHTEKRIS